MSLSVIIYNQSGEKLSTKKLDKDLFAEERINPTLVHEFVLMQLANARMSNAHSKDRGEVSYSNRKLFKQKGTGNARPGSLKSPLRKQG
jgi:large subunit ribosomal protein L4